MSARHWALALAMAAVTAPAMADDEAVSRGGGGGSSSGAESRAPSSSGGSSSSSWSGSSSSSSSGGSSYYDSSSSSSYRDTGAESRHPRPGTGHGSRRGGFYSGGYTTYHYSPYYRYYPYYRHYRYYPFGFYGYYDDWGWAPYSYQYGYGPRYYGYNRYYETGSIRLMVEPVEAEVDVDGYYAGTVDDFDGFFQRLNLKPGRHEITLKHPGYKTHKIKVYVPLGHTVKIRHDMEKGSSDQVTEAVVGTPEPGEREYGRKARRGAEEEEADADDAETGGLRLNVRPDDAGVYVDGKFLGTGRRVRRLDLSAGSHRIEVVRPGFKTYEREVEVRPGRSEELEIELERVEKAEKSL